MGDPLPPHEDPRARNDFIVVIVVTHAPTAAIEIGDASGPSVLVVAEDPLEGRVIVAALTQAGFRTIVLSADDDLGVASDAAIVTAVFDRDEIGRLVEQLREAETRREMPPRPIIVGGFWGDDAERFAAEQAGAAVYLARPWGIGSVVWAAQHVTGSRARLDPT